MLVNLNLGRQVLFIFNELYLLVQARVVKSETKIFTGITFYSSKRKVDASFLFGLALPKPIV